MAKKKTALGVQPKKEAPQGDSSKFWLAELTAADKREDTWRKRAQRVVNLYRDERERNTITERRTNILWSNTEILKAVLFQDIGHPDVRRRFPKKGPEEKITRTTALVLERSLEACVYDYDIKCQIENVVEDMLLTGRGTAWICYDAEVVEAPKKSTEDDASDEDREEDGPEPIDIADQTVKIEHVFWKDYRTSAGRKENDIWWKARRHQYDKAELKAYFPDHADSIPMDAEIPDAPKDKDIQESFKRANVWEIWDKSKRQRLYIAEGYAYILKKDDDPYKLQQFFPCPPALYGVKTSNTLVPIPEYTLYQDQCEELDQITTRLNRLIDALRRRGVYDATSDGPDNQLASLAYAKDNEFLPYKGFAGLMEKGGLKGVFATEDLQPTITVVQTLFEQRNNLIQTIYEVTGISDVVRGASNPNETATAQRIKGQFGSLRITTRQGKVQEFIRACMRLKGEIIAEHYTREKLQDMTGIDMPLQAEQEQAKQQLAAYQQQMQMAQQAQAAQQQPQPAQPGAQPGAAPPQAAPQPPAMPPVQMPQIDPATLQEMQRIVSLVPWEPISEILRSDQRRNYKIDIETDDTAQFDEQEEKQSRIEFLNTMQPIMQNALLVTQQTPELLPFAREMVLFTVKGFKAGRPLEEAFEDAFDALASKPPAEPQPNPDVIKAQAEAKRSDAELQIKQMMAQHESQAAQLKNQTTQLELQIKQRELAGKGIELAGKQADLETQQQSNQLDLFKQQQEVANAQVVNDRAAEAHELAMEGARQGQRHADEKAEATAMSAPAGPATAPSKPAAATAQSDSAIMTVLEKIMSEIDDLRNANMMLMQHLFGQGQGDQAAMAN